MTPKTETLVSALRILSIEIQSGDGVANAVVAEAADRLTLMANLVARHIEETKKDTAEMQTACETMNGATETIQRLKERIKLLEEELIDAKGQYAVLVADVVLYEDRGERIKRLEEALDTLVKMHRSFIGEDDGITHERSYYCFYKGQYDHWKKAIDVLEAKEAKP